MLFKKIALVLIAATCLFSATTNAKTIKAHTCSLAVLPFGITMIIESQKESIMKAYSEKGYYPTLVSSLQAASSFEFYLDASVDCTTTYFGTAAQTTVRLVDMNSEKILSRVQTPVVMDMFACKVELQKAIASLPECSIK